MWAHCVEEVAIVAVRWGDYGGGLLFGGARRHGNEYWGEGQGMDRPTASNSSEGSAMPSASPRLQHPASNSSEGSAMPSASPRLRHPASSPHAQVPRWLRGLLPAHRDRAQGQHLPCHRDAGGRAGERCGLGPCGGGEGHRLPGRSWHLWVRGGRKEGTGIFVRGHHTYMGERRAHQLRSIIRWK